EPGQIGRNHMKSVGELRNEIAEHVACRWKAVQQKDCRSVQATGLPVEDVDAVDGCSPVSDLGHCAILLGFMTKSRFTWLVVPSLLQHSGVEGPYMASVSPTSASSRRWPARSRPENLPGRNGAPRWSPRSALASCG